MDIDSQTLKFLGYARKSSEDNKERQAASLPDQIYILEGLKSRHNLTVIDSLQESCSAYKKGREVFETMLGMIEASKANAILTWHPNRLARNMTDGGRIIDLFDTGKLKEVRTPGRIYHNTSEDKFMLTLEFGLSKKDSDDKSIVVSRGLDKKCRDGWRPGVAPTGYLNDRATESGFRRILTDPDRLPFITKIFELFRAGTAVTDIHRVAKKEWGYRTLQRKRMGGKALSISSIYAILNNKFYTGQFEYPLGSGNWFHGNHEPAITEELFDECQILLGRKSKYKLKKHNYAYTSMAKCVCGSGITAETKYQVICSVCKKKYGINSDPDRPCPGCGTRISEMKNPKLLHYTYYRCSRRVDPHCKQKAVRVECLEEQINQELESIEIPQCFIDWAVKQIQTLNEDEKDFREDTIKSLHNAHNDARKRLDNLVQLKISAMNSDGSLLSNDEFRAQKISIEAEIKGLENQLKTIDNRMFEVAERINETFVFASQAREKFAFGDLKTKRGILSTLGSNLILENQKLRITSPIPFLTIKKMKTEAPIIGKALEPTFLIDDAIKMAALYAAIPSLLRGKELNLVCEIMSLTCSRTLPRTYPHQSCDGQSVIYPNHGEMANSNKPVHDHNRVGRIRTNKQNNP